jgi:hypothetical protein
MIAVSGIDSTVKIFSPDARARADAAAARHGIRAVDPATFSSVRDHRHTWTMVAGSGVSGDTDDEPEDTDGEEAGQSGGGPPWSEAHIALHELMGISDDPRTPSATAAEDENRNGDEEQEEEMEELAQNGLLSRKRLHDEYRITVRNDMNRRAGKQLQLSREMLNTLVGRLGDVMAENMDPEDAENCCIM